MAIEDMIAIAAIAVAAAARGAASEVGDEVHPEHFANVDEGISNAPFVGGRVDRARIHAAQFGLTNSANSDMPGMNATSVSSVFCWTRK